jgi:N-acetylglutamate synthase-like GNAT family acetyltransferase
VELYKQYLKEREGIELKHTEDCFITYKIYDDNTASIIDIYSRPEVRGRQVMKNMVEDILKEFKEKEIETVFGYTDERTNGWQRSEELMLKFGFRYCGKDPEDKKRNNYYLDL